MIDNLILNQLALAPYRLIKKRAEIKRTVLKQPIMQPHSDHNVHYKSGQTLKPDSRLEQNHSLTTHFQIQSKIRTQKTHFQNRQIQFNKRKTDKMRKQTNEFTGGFIPKEQKEKQSPAGERTNKWQEQSDREESVVA